MTIAYLDITSLAKNLAIDPTPLHALADAIGTDPVIAALADAMRAGNDLHSPAAFVQKRARQLAATAERKQLDRQRQHERIDLERSTRQSEGERQMSAYQAEQILFASLDEATIERLRADVIAALPPAIAAGLKRKKPKDSATLRGLIVARHRAEANAATADDGPATSADPDPGPH